MMINVFSNTVITIEQIKDIYNLTGLVAIQHSNKFITLRSEDIVDMNQVKFVETVAVESIDEYLDYLESFYEMAA